MMDSELQITVSWFMKEDNTSELHFNYYDYEGNLVGNINVDANGSICWKIDNLSYKDYLMSIISYIYAGDINDKISFETTESKSLRWTRARIYIEKNGLKINYHHPMDLFVEERGYTR